MKKLLSLTALIFIFSNILYCQETYNVLKVTSETAPLVDGEIDEIWSAAELVTLTKDVDDGDRTTEKDPDEVDYKAEFAVFWADTGLYILLQLNDDVYVNDNGAYWYRDDDVNFLIPPDLTSTGVTPLEFAWLVMSEEEGKAIPYQSVPEDAIAAAWSNEGTEYILEVYISWDAFSEIGSEGSDVLFEVRARDDDEDGAAIYPQSFLQWSTDQKSVESDGIGLGTLTLLAEEAIATSIKSRDKESDNRIKIFPNPLTQYITIRREQTMEENLIMVNCIGQIVYEKILVSDEETIHLNSIQPGLYIIKIGDYQEMVRVKP